MASGYLVFSGIYIVLSATIAIRYIMYWNYIFID